MATGSPTSRRGSSGYFFFRDRDLELDFDFELPFDFDFDFEDFDFVLPSFDRSLFTVRAAISLARLVDRPRFFSLDSTCSYWRSSFLLHAFGIRRSPFAKTVCKCRARFNRGG
jgi:hypothetical protein